MREPQLAAPPESEVLTPSHRTSMDAYCRTVAGMDTSVQLEGVQHYIQWFDMDDATGVVTPCLPLEAHLNGTTLCRNDDQAFEKFQVVSISLLDFQACRESVSQSHARGRQLLEKHLLATEQRWQAGAAAPAPVGAAAGG